MAGFHDIKFYTMEDAHSEPKRNGEETATDMRKISFSNAPIVRTTIGRSDVRMPYYVNMCLTVLTVIAIFFMGIEIDLAIIRSVLMRPIGPIIGFISQFVFMPLAAWGIGAVFLTEDIEKLGLIMVGSSPGGNLSNFWTLLLDGDVNLSVTMTMISSISSFGMTSLWVWLLGTQFSGERHIQASYLPMFVRCNGYVGTLISLLFTDTIWHDCTVPSMLHSAIVCRLPAQVQAE